MPGARRPPGGASLHPRGTCPREVYCHAVGLGLGVWQVHPIQNALFLEAWSRALTNLTLRNVCLDLYHNQRIIYLNIKPQVKVLDFSWISPKPSEVAGLVSGTKFPGSEVTIAFSRRDPFAPLKREHSSKLVRGVGEGELVQVVAMFAWDGNSYVGKEYKRLHIFFNIKDPGWFF